MKKITFAIGALMLSTAFVNAQIWLPSSNSSPNSNVGINQASPNARLHISDDPNQVNCKPAILVNSNLGNTLQGNIGMESEPGPETCSTPYVFRNLMRTETASNINTVNIDVTGKTSLGDIFGFNAAALSRLSVESNMGLYSTNNDYLRLGFDISSSGQSVEPLLYWNTAEPLPFSIGYGSNPSTVNKILTVLSDEKVGINTTTPLAALHIKSELANPNDPGANQIQGLLIENNGFNNNDYALEIRTGQNPPGSTLNNGRVFTVSNAGTVHVGPMLNWETPNDSPELRMYVQGGIRAEKVKVDIADQNGWADYVFEEGYELMSTTELESYIKEHKHLPGVPSAAEVVENGIDVAEMNKILLEKIEELTLRIIELEKRNPDSAE